VSEIAKRIDEVVSASLAPALKQAGYRKTGRTFRRSQSRCVLVINVQASWTNVGSVGQFTINLGVYYPDAARLHGGFRVTDKPIESDCIVSERIGKLMPARLDHWWKVTEATNVRSLGDDLVTAWSQFGEPWLVAHTDPARARTFMLELRSPFWGAIFSVLLEERAEAVRFLQEALNDVRDRPDLLANLRKWGIDHGLLPEAAV